MHCNFFMPSYTPNKPGKDYLCAPASSHHPFLLTYFSIPNSLPYLGLGQPGKKIPWYNSVSLSVNFTHEKHNNWNYVFFSFLNLKTAPFSSPNILTNCLSLPPHTLHNSPVWFPLKPLVYGNSILPAHAFRVGFSSPHHHAIVRKMTAAFSLPHCLNNTLFLFHLTMWHSR